MSQILLGLVEKSSLKSEVPDFNIGDTVDVHTRILEGEKERIQIFNGVVIARAGSGSRETFTVRRIVAGEGVERQVSRSFAQDGQDRSQTIGCGSPCETVFSARPRR